MKAHLFGVFGFRVKVGAVRTICNALFFSAGRLIISNSNPGSFP